jgi:cysteine desulfurase
MREWIYLDNNATTRPLEAVVDAMRPFLTEAYANPSSVHQFGQSVRHQVECARARVARLIGAEPREIVFTSGGTESINLAVRGALAFHPGKRRLVTSAVEHSAVQRLGRQLAREGYEVVEIGVDADGRLDLNALADHLDEQTALVSVMWANNETGILFDVEAVAALARERGVPLHLDAVQAVGKVPVDVGAVPAALLSLSAHKFHGPKGAGALFVRSRTRLRPLIIGGRQERDLRGGTENVPAIVGMGVAAEDAASRPTEDVERIRGLRDRLERGIVAAVESARVIGGNSPRVHNTSNIGFHTLQAEALLLLLSERGICASSGSACASGSLEPSHVLGAMGVDREYAHGSIRFSLSRFTTVAEIDQVIATIPELVGRLAVMSGRPQ